MLCRWVFTLQAKLYTLQCGLLRFHYLWSCWVSLPRSGLLLEVLGQYCWHWPVVRCNYSFCSLQQKFLLLYFLFQIEFHWHFFFPILTRYLQISFQVQWFIQLDLLLWMNGFKQRLKAMKFLVLLRFVFNRCFMTPTH